LFTLKRRITAQVIEESKRLNKQFVSDEYDPIDPISHELCPFLTIKPTRPQMRGDCISFEGGLV
jgi:hypothetical protein